MLKRFVGSLKLVDYFIYSAIGIMLCYVVLMLSSTQILADDWWYGHSYELNPVFYFGRGWHPGRHISEMLNILPLQIFGSQLLGSILHNPLLGIRIAATVSSLIVLFSLWFISLLYIDISNRRLQTVSLLIIILLSLFLDATSHFTHILMITGGFVFALLVWTPFLYFYRFQSLPQWMKDDIYRTYGIMAVLFYLGTQVVDSSYMVMCSLSVMLLVFLYCAKYLPKFFENLNIDESEFCLLRNLLILHILFGIYALVRNTIFAPDQVDFRESRISFDLIVLYRRFLDQGIYQKIALMGSFVYLIWYLQSLKNMMKDKISLKKYFYFSTIIVGLLFSCLFIILGTYIDQAIWIIWLNFLNLAVNLYQNNQKLVKIFLPIFVLGLFVNSFRLSTEEQNKLGRYIEIFVENLIPVNAERKEKVQNLLGKLMISGNTRNKAKLQRLYGIGFEIEIEKIVKIPNFDFQMGAYFKKAELENKEFVEIPMPRYFLNHHSWPYGNIYPWMQKYGYTEDEKKIIFVDEKQKSLEN